MNKKQFLILLLGLSALSWRGISVADEGGEQVPVMLVSAAEAVAPAANMSGYLAIGRADEDGPVIQVVTPQLGRAYQAPVPIEVKFISKEGSEIDPASLKVEYLKLFTIDLTPRVKPYVTAAGIHMPKADLPSGHHSLRVSISDKSGRTGQSHLTPNAVYLAPPPSRRGLGGGDK